jgi:hypothetical protein
MPGQVGVPAQDDHGANRTLRAFGGDSWDGFRAVIADMKSSTDERAGRLVSETTSSEWNGDRWRALLGAAWKAANMGVMQVSSFVS